MTATFSGQGAADACAVNVILCGDPSTSLFSRCLCGWKDSNVVRVCAVVDTSLTPLATPAHKEFRGPSFTVASRALGHTLCESGGCDVAVECSHRDGETLFQRTMFFLRSGVSVVLAPEACCALQQLDVEVPSSQDSMGCWLQLQQQALACGVSIIACSDYSIAQHLLRQCLRDMAHSLIPGLHAQVVVSRPSHAVPSPSAVSHQLRTCIKGMKRSPQDLHFLCFHFLVSFFLEFVDG